MSGSNEKRWELKRKVHAKFKGRCAYCGISIDMEDFHLDHIISKSRHKADRTIIFQYGISNIDHIDNLNPACSQCNIYKCDHDIEYFREYIESQIVRLRRNIPGLLLAEKYGLVHYVDAPVVFYFEKYPNG